jgi:superfamily I DNA/RNA helicase
MNRPSSIKHAYNKGLVPPTKYLFFDEFQDFTRLQYELCLNWMGANHIKEVWVAGDTAQALYRFAGANAAYMVGMPNTDSIMLPHTYRFGEVITTNAKQYLDRMVVNVDGNATPSDKKGEMITYYGDE